MAKALTAKALENLKPGDARKEVPDGLIRGLFFVLQPTGKASWAVRYRSRGRTRKLDAWYLSGDRPEGRTRNRQSRLG